MTFHELFITLSYVMVSFSIRTFPVPLANILFLVADILHRVS